MRLARVIQVLVPAWALFGIVSAAAGVFVLAAGDRIWLGSGLLAAGGMALVEVEFVTRVLRRRGLWRHRSHQPDTQGLVRCSRCQEMTGVPERHEIFCRMKE